MGKLLRTGAVDGCFIAGLAAIVRGVHAIYPPAALIVAGAFLIIGALLAGAGRRG